MTTTFGNNNNRSNTPPPLLVIVGETASGKSDLAIRLAQHFGGEIICADSWTVRREVNIGTAKPTADEQAKTVHHLLDIVGPDEAFTAAVFKQLAEQKISEINRRGKLAIMVGGTGLYVDGVVFDFGFLPEGDPNLRAQLEKKSITELLQEIASRGIELGDDVDRRNKRRLIRLIETNGLRPSKKPLRENTLLLGLKVDRNELKQRIESRVDQMLANGLEQEVWRLVDSFGWRAEALKGVGYAQWRDYFDGRQSMPETRQKIVKATLDLAKRQRTWQRRNKSIHWLNTPVKWNNVVALVTTTLDSDHSIVNHSLLQ